MNLDKILYRLLNIAYDFSMYALFGSVGLLVLAIIVWGILKLFR